MSAPTFGELGKRSVEREIKVATHKGSIQAISVIVPVNPFAPKELREKKHCLAALNVEKLMEWWPGKPHVPHRNRQKVTAIQRSLDWKRVAQIAAYLLQREIVEAPDRLDACFREIYEPTKFDPGREWPPRLPRVVGYQRSEYPTFSNVLLHVNGAELQRIDGRSDSRAAKLVFNERSRSLKFSVIDGQHRINGAYLAVRILQEENPNTEWEIASEVFLDLDKRKDAPRRQAQIFIDVNFYQKKVDRSLVADLFPTARGQRGPLDDKERAQDLGRKLMLETGPLVGMVQIPGIKFGVKDVVALATLNSAIEDVIEDMVKAGIESLDAQADFLAQCLEAWFEATGRREDLQETEELDPENVAYQGRAVVSYLTLLPACIWKLRKAKHRLISEAARDTLTNWLRGVMNRAGLMKNGRFLAKGEFRDKGYLGSGGLARFRDTLWAASLSHKKLSRLRTEHLASLAAKNRARVRKVLAGAK